VVNNVLGDPVFALSTPDTSEYYNQIDVSFGAGSKFLFDVSDPTMANISLVFGTTVDDSSTINDSFVTYQDGLVILDICSGYVGESLKYFEDTSAGMGYVEPQEKRPTIPIDDLNPHLIGEVRFNSENYNEATSSMTNLATRNDLATSFRFESTLVDPYSTFQPGNGLLIKGSTSQQNNGKKLIFRDINNAKIERNNRSICIWFNPQSTNSQLNKLITLWDGDGIMWYNGRLEVNSILNVKNTGFGDGPGNVNTGWQLIVFAFKDGNASQFWLDEDNLDNTIYNELSLAKTFFPDYIHNLYLGFGTNGGVAYMDIIFQNIRIYDKVLTREDVDKIYEAGANQPQLVSYNINRADDEELYTSENEQVSTLSLVHGTIYVFKQDLSTNIGYPILLRDSSHNLVVQDVVGEAGYPGAYTQVTIGTDFSYIHY